MNELARTLRDLARRWGVSEEYIAEFTGLDRSYIRRLFSGEKRNPSRRVLVAVALALVSAPSATGRTRNAWSMRSRPSWRRRWRMPWSLQIGRPWIIRRRP